MLVKSDSTEISVTVPEIITHVKRMRIDMGALSDFEYIKESKQIGCYIISVPPSFTVSKFQNVERFLERIPRCTLSASSNLSSVSSSTEIAISESYDYAVEFRHPSWRTEEPWGVVKTLQSCHGSN